MAVSHCTQMNLKTRLAEQENTNHRKITQRRAADIEFKNKQN